jgi:hypothetical protein
MKSRPRLISTKDSLLVIKVNPYRVAVTRIAWLGVFHHCDDVFGQGFESFPIFWRHGNRNMASLAGIHIAYDAGLPSVSAGGDLALEAVFQCTL